MSRLTLTLFGGFDAKAPSGPVAPLGRKLQAVLAYLGVRPGQFHSRDRLASLLWGDVGQEQARHSMRQTLFSLRRAIPAHDALFQTVGETVALNPDAVVVDAVEFAKLVAKGTPDALQEAAALYHGDFLDGLRVREPAFDEWAAAERERFRTMVTTALDRLVDTHMQAGDLDAAADVASRLLLIDPARESAHRMLMRLYLQTGRRGLALRQYRACETVLARDFGVKPDAETRRLFESISAAGPEDANGGTPAILVAEDEPITRAVLEGFLGLAGYEVTAVSDGAEALLQMSRRHFDLIITDLAMPTIDGLTLADIVVRKALHTPVVVVTGQSGDELEVRALELGAVDYLRKPIQKDVLLARVKKVLRTAR